MIFSLEILEKNNDDYILILVIYWKKTGLLHTKISNHNIICSSQKPRKLLSLPLKSSSWLFSLNASLFSYKMSSSLPSSALLMPHFFKDFTIVSLLTRCQEFFTHLQKLEIEGHFTLPAGVTWWVGASIHFAYSSCINPLNGLLTEMSRGCNWLVNPSGITARCVFSLVASLFVDVPWTDCTLIKMVF